MPRKKYKSHKERSSELLTKAWGLYYRLEALTKAAEPLIQTLPVGSKERDELAFAVVAGIGALKEHDPMK